MSQAEEYPRAPVPSNPTFDSLREASHRCRACDLYKSSTQTVFSDGPPRARIMMVGEQPGNDEDVAGRPFVGPAGRLLDRALEQAGIDRREVYVTNVVKHFKWEPRGTKRIHKKPNAREIRACKAWLDAEIDVIDPEIIVLLGATAAQSLIGQSFRVTERRGQPFTQGGRRYLATVHPSSILRADDETREMEMQRFVADLRVLRDMTARQRRAG